MLICYFLSNIRLKFHIRKIIFRYVWHQRQISCIFQGLGRLYRRNRKSYRHAALHILQGRAINNFCIFRGYSVYVESLVSQFLYWNLYCTMKWKCRKSYFRKLILPWKLHSRIFPSFWILTRIGQGVEMQFRYLWSQPYHTCCNVSIYFCMEIELKNTSLNISDKNRMFAKILDHVFYQYLVFGKLNVLLSPDKMIWLGPDRFMII